MVTAHGGVLRPVVHSFSEGWKMLGIREKLSLGFLGLLAIILVIGLEGVMLSSELGDSLGTILQGDYRSVIACRQMKESLERINSGVLLLLLGHDPEGRDQIVRNELQFEEALQIELNTITVPGEEEKAHRLQALFGRYRSALGDLTEKNLTGDAIRWNYFTKLLPIFRETRDLAEDILQMNQQDMHDKNDLARHRAASAARKMYFLLIVGAVTAGGYILLVSRWIFRPITSLIHSADNIKAGDLDSVIKSNSGDEIGQLSQAFNSMAESLRLVRRTNEARLDRLKHSVEQAFKSLPDPVVVVDIDGRVEVATESAAHVFGLRPGVQIQSLRLEWLTELFNNALNNGQSMESKTDQRALQCFIDGEERYFSPTAVSMLDRDKQLSAVMLILSDITQQHHQEDLKRGVISVVSHELKTPLTSVRMAIRLLLEEDIGEINEKQTEVLMAAEADADRLHRTLKNLLDIRRIESGNAPLQFQSASLHHLASNAVTSFRCACYGRGLNLMIKLPDDLPEVWADPTLVPHIFENLLSNAVKYTSPGGTITVLRIGTRRIRAYLGFRHRQGYSRAIPGANLRPVFQNSRSGGRVRRRFGTRDSKRDRGGPRWNHQRP